MKKNKNEQLMLQSNNNIGKTRNWQVKTKPVSDSESYVISSINIMKFQMLITLLKSDLTPGAFSRGSDLPEDSSHCKDGVHLLLFAKIRTKEW